MNSGDDLRGLRRSAANFVIAWVAQAPSAARLAEVASRCNWQIEEALEVIRYVVRSECSAETVLLLLNKSGFWNPDGEFLRVDDPEFFGLVTEMIEGLRQRKFGWFGPPKHGGERFDIVPDVVEWRDVPDLEWMPMYDGDSIGLGEELPRQILDAFEILGSHSWEATSATARKMLIEMGYDPNDI